MVNKLREAIEWALIALIGGALVLLVLGISADAKEYQHDYQIPAPKFEKLKLDWRPKSAVLDDGVYEITYPEKIIHDGKELSGQVCREGKSIAISASKNKTRAQIQAEIITQIFKLSAEDSETMVRFVQNNRKLVDFLLELSVTEILPK